MCIRRDAGQSGPSFEKTGIPPGVLRALALEEAAVMHESHFHESVMLQGSLS